MSESNNNIPMRITQLEEVTEYEDGMFYAVAKAGRGTYKIPVDEMTPNEQALSDKIENEIVPAVENSFAYGTVDESEIASFPDGSELPLKVLEVAVNPVQNLHGYDAPWVGGAGKNKLPMTVEGIKAVNTYHSWSGNSTTINNVTITIETDSVGNVTGIRFNGTASADITFNLATNISIPNGSYKWSNDQIVNISNLWMSLTSPNIAITLSTQKEVNVTVSNDSIGSAYIYASSGNIFNNIVFKPMIRLASITDATFAPYSNICPISGWSAVDVTIQDDIDNPTTTETITIQLGDTYYGGKLDVVSGVLTLTHEIADLPSLGWGKSTNTANIFFYVLYTSGANGTYNDAATNVKSNIYTPKSRNSLTNVQGTVGVSAEANALYIADGRFDDYTVAQFKEAVSDVQLLLPLTTPLEVQLSPTQVKSLKGYNNISADTGNILKVEYIRDLDIVINSLLERIAALEG